MIAAIYARPSAGQEKSHRNIIRASVRECLGT